MRKILVGVAVLLMAGTAWGAVGMSLHSDKASVAPGEVFTVTLSIDTDLQLIGWNAKFLEPAGFPVVASYLSAGNTWDTNTSAAGSAILPVGAALPLNSLNGTGLLGASPLGNSAGSGAVFQMVLTVPAATPAPSTVLVGVASALVTDADFTDYNLDVARLPINIVPEPVSALLLLAGLPMLRRRR